ncbi:MAG: hypothetical protein WDM78_11705 [Puia sp.]
MEGLSKKIAELNYADLGEFRYVDITNDKGIVSTKLLHSKRMESKAWYTKGQKPMTFSTPT